MSSPSRLSTIAPLIIGCAQFMHQFDGSVIATALPSMAASLHDDPLKLNLAITCYLLSLAVFVPISGWMADRFGAKRVFMAAIVVFTTSSIFCGLSNSLVEIVIFRTLQGIGGAMMTPVGRVIVVKSVPKFEIVKAMNYISIPSMLAPLMGPSVGGFVVTYFSWRWIFFINLPIGILGLILVRAYIPDLREEEPGPFDLRGFVYVGLALAGLVFGFAAIGRGPLPPSVIVASLALGAICGTLYLIHNRRAENPILDLSLLKVRTFAASLWGGALFYIGTTSQIFLLALLLQIGFGLSAFHAGLTLLASATGSALMRFTVRPILRVFGFRRLLIVNGLLTGLFLVTCGLFTTNTPFPLILLILLIGGFSRSIQFTAIQSLGYAEIPSAMMSRATSFLAMAQQLTQSIGVGLAALAVHLAMLLHGHIAMTPREIAVGFFTIGALSGASIIIFYLLPAQAGSELTARESGGARRAP